MCECLYIVKIDRLQNGYKLFWEVSCPKFESVDAFSSILPERALEDVIT